MPWDRGTNVRRLAGLLALGAATLVVAGCGSVGYTKAGGDRGNGKELFTQKCSSCHTLADAGTSGKVGPNLDDAFRRARKDGLTEATVRQVVRGQIAYPVTNPVTGSPGMPADVVTGQDANDVAAYVAAVAGQPVAATPGGATTAGGTDAGADGKSVFASAGCGGCHTLADAGASGNVGPNLDEAKPAKERVLDRVTNGKGVMPPFKGQLSDAQIEAVAQYVTSVAGK